MNPEFKGLQGVTFFVGGVKIGEGTTESVFNNVYTEEPVAIGRYEGSLTLTDVEISRDFLLGLGAMDVIVNKLAPYRKPRSKKKRIRKKFAKKYTISQVAYHDCIITNFGEEK